MKIDSPTLETLATSIIIIEPDTKISFVNKRFTQLTGYQKKEVIGKSWTKLVYKKDLKKMLKYYKQRIQNKKTPTEYDFRFVDKKNKIKWVHVRVTIIPKTKKIMASLIDITKRKEAEEKLIISDVIYKNVPSGIAFLDKNYKLISYNPAYAKMIKKNTPFTAKQAIGKTYWDYCPGSKPQVYKWYSTVMKTGKTIAKYNFPLKIKTKKEEKTTYWDTTVVPVKKEGKIIGILINTNDVTKRFEAEQKIIEMNEMKSHFIRNASHELKTPITVMMMDVDLLKQQCQKDKLQKEKIKEIIEMLDRNVKRLNHTTENILDFEKIRKGTTNLFLKKRNLNKTIQETYEEMKTVIKNKKIKIIKKFDKIPEFYFDKEKIKRVITNLLDNSIKFSDKNSKVIITTKKEKNKAIVTIRDYGAGVEEKEINKLFEPFYKSKEHEKGTGIGLSISRETIKKHGGRIWAEKQDKGAKFIFEIPIKQKKK